MSLSILETYWLVTIILYSDIFPNAHGYSSFLGLSPPSAESPPSQQEPYLESVNQPPSGFLDYSNIKVGSSFSRPSPPANPPPPPPPAPAPQQYQFQTYDTNSANGGFLNPSNVKVGSSFSRPSPAAAAPQPQQNVQMNYQVESSFKKPSSSQGHHHKPQNLQSSQTQFQNQGQFQTYSGSGNQQLAPAQWNPNVQAAGTSFSSFRDNKQQQKDKSAKKGNEKPKSGFGLLGMDVGNPNEGQNEKANQEQKYREINDRRDTDFLVEQANIRKENQRKELEQAEIRKLEKEQKILLKRLDALEHKDKSGHRGSSGKDKNKETEEPADYDEEIKNVKHSSKGHGHGGHHGAKNRHGTQNIFDDPSPYVDKRFLFGGRNLGTRIRSSSKLLLTIMLIVALILRIFQWNN